MKKARNKNSRWRARLLRASSKAVVLTSAGAFGSAWVARAAGPQGMTVSQGTVSAVRNGPKLEITASHNAVINWQSFNIGAGETTTFHQPSANSVVWNRINDANPSQIWGTLNANGFVVLMNQNGFYFGPNSSVNVGGFLATTAAMIPPPDAAGGMWNFSGPPPLAKIESYGSINVAKGGSLFLISDKVENHGSLDAPEGQIGLFAGKKVLLSERPDGRGLSAAVELPQGSVDNSGRIVANGGEIALHAEVVNQSGLLQADSVRTQNGVIELVASKAIDISPSSIIQANGSSDGPSDGGKISIKSTGSFKDAAGSRIEALGGANGGNGGSIELSAISIGNVESSLSAAARSGWTSGSLLFDPYDIRLTSGAGDTSSPDFVHQSVPPNQPGDLLTLDVTSAFQGFSNIRLQASHDITLAHDTTWDLAQSTGIGASGSKLTLEAGNNIIVEENAHLVAKNGWSVSFLAGADFSTTTPTARPGVGGIYLNGGPPDANGVAPNLHGSIEAADGEINLEAGHEVLVGAGFVRTVGGGNISVKTGDGDVVSGSNRNTYDYSNLGYTISSAGLGGIGSANGGNVSINAGRDILSFTAWIGAFGDTAANVDLQAARDVKGLFLVRKGVGTIEAGRDVANADTAATLGLIAGGWNVHGDRDVYINEVFNPNGSLNGARLKGIGTVKFQFDYASDAYANISAGNSVQLGGQSVLHTQNNPTRPPIYPPILDVNAGAGGVTLANDVVLYPSKLGALKITTTDGGSLSSAPAKFSQLIMSDTGSLDYTTFASGLPNGHAPTPVHIDGLGDGVHLDISGDIKNIFMRSPMAADIKIGRDAINFAFEGQNLSANDTTKISIGRDFFSRSDRTSEAVSDVPDIAAIADDLLAINPDLGRRFTYAPATRQLTVQGILTAEEVTFLKHPTKYLADLLTGSPQLGEDGFPIAVPAVFTTDFAALDRLAANTQDIPTSGLAYAGIQVGGPGRLEMTARNMDLGISQGIRSIGPLKNAALAPIAVSGVSIGITLQGDLQMASSQIASFNGGDIKLTGAGKMDIGSQNSFASDDTPKGIYTGHGGNVVVQAVGDISVNGSRIASYDGGNVTVTSEQGAVDAGSGAKGFFSVTTSALNDSGVLETRNDKFFGSGIMAVTRTDGDAKVGDIQVTAAKDILANAGGIMQIPFNSHDQSDAQLTLTAGHDIIATQSGILGRNVTLAAQGDIQGLVVATGDARINAGQNVSVSAVIGGSGKVSGGGTVSGTLASAGNLNVAGSEVSAAVISTGGSANTSGDTSGAKVGAFATTAATGAQKTVDSADKTIASQAATLADEEEEKKKRLPTKAPVLQRRVGRVTVILPKT